MTSTQKAKAVPVYETVATMDPIAVVELLASELSADPNSQTAIAAEFSTHNPSNIQGSHQDALVGVMISLLTEPINLEIVGIASGAEHFKFHIYLFGMDRPFFSFSLGCIATNPTLSACISKICASGYEEAGTKFFLDRSVPPDATRVEYKNFDFNALFDVHFLRTTLFLHYVQVFISCIDLCYADQFPQTEVYARASILLQRVIEDVESRLVQQSHTTGRSTASTSSQPPRLSPEVLTMLQTLRASEKTPQSVKKLFPLALANRLRAKASVRRV